MGQHGVLLAQDGVDARREARTPDGDLPVAFDEDDEDVLAAQPGQQVRSGDGGFGVGTAGGLGEPARVAARRLEGMHLRDGQPGGAGRGDRGPRGGLQGQARGQRPDGGDGNQAAKGAAAVPGGHGGDVDRGCGDGDDEQSDTDPDHDENDVGERGADGVADHAGGRPDAAPVVQRVERPVELLPHRYVEDLVEGEHAEQEPGDRGHDPSRPQRQHQRDSHQDQRFHRDADESAEAEPPGTVGRHEIEPQEPERKPEDGDPHGPAGARAVRITILGLALGLLWFDLVAPDRSWRFSLGAFVRIPVEALVLVAIALVLPLWPRRIVATIAGLLLSVLTLDKILNIAVWEELNRPFNPLNDWGSIRPAAGVVRDAIGTALTNVVLVVIWVGIALLVVAVTAATIHVTAVAARHRRGALRGLIAVTAVWALSAGLSLQATA